MAGKKKRTRRYQRGSLGLSRNKRSWVVKYYYAPGKQTTKTLGSKTQISRKRAEEMRADIVRGLNQNPDQSLADETVERFIEDVFIPMKIDSGDWRENTSKECTREIRRHVITEIGDVTWADLTPTVLRALLRKKAELGLRRHTVNHIRNYLTDICKIATAEGYLKHNISEGLKPPARLIRPSSPKLVVTLEEYATAWSLLEERERLCFDLVMFAGMRASETFGLWCGDVKTEGIEIERSFFKGRYESPKTQKSQRSVGVPDEILTRLVSWMQKLGQTARRTACFHRMGW